MDAHSKLVDLARAYLEHQRVCAGYLGVALTPFEADDEASVELICHVVPSGSSPHSRETRRGTCDVPAS